MYLSDVPGHGEVDLEAQLLLVELALDDAPVGALDDEVLQLAHRADVEGLLEVAVAEEPGLGGHGGDRQETELPRHGLG